MAERRIAPARRVSRDRRYSAPRARVVSIARTTTGRGSRTSRPRRRPRTSASPARAAAARGKLGRAILLVLLLAASWLVAMVVIALIASVKQLEGLAVLLILVLFVVGVWVYVRLTFATPALVLEDLRVMAAIRRSMTLTKGRWWRTLGVLLLSGIVISIINQVLEVGLGFASGVVIGLTMPASSPTATLVAEHELAWGAQSEIPVEASASSHVGAAAMSSSYMDVPATELWTDEILSLIHISEPTRPY